MHHVIFCTPIFTMSIKTLKNIISVYYDILKEYMKVMASPIYKPQRRNIKDKKTMPFLIKCMLNDQLFTYISGKV